MGFIQITDNSIWLKHIDADRRGKETGWRASSQTRRSGSISRAPPADGRKCVTARMAASLRGCGLREPRCRISGKPCRARRGDKVPFSLADRRRQLSAHVQSMLSEWESEEDEEAFRDL